ncbi:uncharacterized protein ACA1_144880 [Acanthamoeba castellanii str. Neff]|uniref:Chalcone synthase n=1 Tax=Acanthamoeba castellanii (strain ATCC 30010 / Neff) TaxID=1257118 RepID=L8GCT0_ACACF|nr:uncharacterized protein ACA1_144880 [Acanthamoeba castellanii str. Neff]ELR10887.1 hypothetical protein ACA1_144880 [Acanthamoeba castellanii str. Neff]
MADEQPQNGLGPESEGQQNGAANGGVPRKGKKEACILGVGRAVPPQEVPTQQYLDFCIKSLQLDSQPKVVEALQKLADRSEIHTRYFCSADPVRPREEWKILPQDFPNSVPTMTVRNKAYCEEAPKLAIEACKKAVADWGGDAKDITHIISVSCTGVQAPGIEFYVMEELGIPRTAERLGINIMGCFGAFRALATAKALAKEDAKNRILIVCTEICSIHFQAELCLETFVGNALFGDGSGSVVVGARPTEKEKTLWIIEGTKSRILEHTPELMTWEASDKGFLMKLSQKIPDSLKSQTPDFADQILEKRCAFSECGWAIHPGGKSILAGIEQVLGLQRWQTECSWEVLKNYGNMSSATFLFVLDELRKKRPTEATAPWVVGMGFGPGLALEGVLLRYPEDSAPKGSE